MSIYEIYMVADASGEAARAFALPMARAIGGCGHQAGSMMTAAQAASAAPAQEGSALAPSPSLAIPGASIENAAAGWLMVDGERSGFRPRRRATGPTDR
jgi:hypothetical protein